LEVEWRKQPIEIVEIS